MNQTDHSKAYRKGLATAVSQWLQMLCVISSRLSTVLALQSKVLWFYPMPFSLSDETLNGSPNHSVLEPLPPFDHWRKSSCSCRWSDAFSLRCSTFEMLITTSSSTVVASHVQGLEMITFIIYNHFGWGIFFWWFSLVTKKKTKKYNAK